MEGSKNPGTPSGTAVVTQMRGDVDRIGVGEKWGEMGYVRK